LLRTEFAKPAAYERQIVNNGKFVKDRSPANVFRGTVFLVNSVISIGRPDETPPGPFTSGDYQFYPDLGLRMKQIRKVHGNKFTFVEWHHYDNPNLIPVKNDGSLQQEMRKDFLVRINMFFRARMIQDQGWQRRMVWRSGGVSYPEGEIFTSWSRPFPQIAYTWALLTLKRERGQWVHEPGDADVLYDTLQELYAHYDPSSGKPHFEDIQGDTGIPYISYAAHRKERSGDGPRGVLNSHASALHFAWIMREASELKEGKGSEAETKWKEVVEKYHPGSKHLFRLLYPAKCEKTNATHWGIVQDAIGTTDMKPDYNAISFNGIAAGYLQADDHELEFVDAVERASHLDYNPCNYKKGWFKDIPGGPGNFEFVARLSRVLPISLSFVGDSIKMSHSVIAAGLEEVLSYGELKSDSLPAGTARRPHDPDKFIVEGERRHYVEGEGRHYILTNGNFESDWVPGFWEEKEYEEVKLSKRFSFKSRCAECHPPRAGTAGTAGRRWTVSRKGNVFFIMANHTYSDMVLSLPVDVSYAIHYQEYKDHSWDDPVFYGFGAALANSNISLPELTPKKLVKVYIMPYMTILGETRN
jgi:hypothetical protein